MIILIYFLNLEKKNILKLKSITNYKLSLNIYLVHIFVFLFNLVIIFVLCSIRSSFSSNFG